jgi:hypothetical protein
MIRKTYGSGGAIDLPDHDTARDESGKWGARPGRIRAGRAAGFTGLALATGTSGHSAQQTAPHAGAPSHLHVRPGYQACTFTAVVGVFLPRLISQQRPSKAEFACHGTPPAAGRAWVLGCRVRTVSVLLFYWESARMERPERDGFVISIDVPGHMPGVAGSLSRGLGALAASDPTVPHSLKLSTGQPRLCAARRRARSGLTTWG